jgi:hypothetical protein
MEKNTEYSFFLVFLFVLLVDRVSQAALELTILLPQSPECWEVCTTMLSPKVF